MSVASTRMAPVRGRSVVSAAALAERIALIIASLFYALATHVGHVHYLFPRWGYYGFTYAEGGLAEFFATVGLVTAGALVMPLRIGRASSIIMLLLFVIVYVPTMTITPALRPDALDRYLPGLLGLAAGFAVASIGSRLSLNETAAPNPPDAFITRAFLTAWLAVSAIVVVNFAPIMTFSGLDAVYEQRVAGNQGGAAMAYAQTYFAGFLSPGLLAIGLAKRRWGLVAVGVVGCVITYMITAQRTVILLPAAVIGMHVLLTRTSPLFRTSGFVVFVMTVLLTISTAMAVWVDEAGLVPTYLQFRTLSLPALTFSQYHDIFERLGLTWWSHVKGLSLLIPEPPALNDNPSWPALGRIVGEIRYGSPEVNHNANVFVGDGIAAGGPVGVVIAGAALAVWLALLDLASRGWSRHFVVLATVPVGLALTNGHLATVLLSFGGLAWLFLFAFYKPKAPRRRKRAAVPARAGT